MAGNRAEAPFRNEDRPTTREKILDAAIDLMSKKGFEAVSIREIAREVGIRESSIYNHFKGKEEIMDSILEVCVADMYSAYVGNMPLDALLEEHGAEGLIDVGLRVYFQGMNKRRISKIWRIIAIEIYRNQKIRAFFRTTMVEAPVAAGEQMFRRMMELGYIKECDPAVLAREYYYYAMYLYFDYLVIRFDETTYDTLMEKMQKDISRHVRFLFEAIKAKEAP